MPPDVDAAWVCERPIAHRGLHDTCAGRPENTLAAIGAAAAAGYAIEIDVRLSADARVMVFHDATLDRLCGRSGIVQQMSARDLSAVEVLQSGERIPRLADALELVAGRVPLIIEIKHEAPADGRFERALVATLAGYRGHVAAMSFTPGSLIHLRRLAPGLARGIVAELYAHPACWPFLTRAECHARRHLLHMARTAPHFVSYKVGELRRAGRMLADKARGLPLICWTVRDRAGLAAARRAGAQITFEGFRPAIRMR